MKIKGMGVANALSRTQKIQAGASRPRVGGESFAKPSTSTAEQVNSQLAQFSDIFRNINPKTPTVELKTYLQANGISVPEENGAPFDKFVAEGLDRLQQAATEKVSGDYLRELKELASTTQRNAKPEELLEAERARKFHTLEKQSGQLEHLSSDTREAAGTAQNAVMGRALSRYAAVQTESSRNYLVKTVG